MVEMEGWNEALRGGIHGPGVLAQRLRALAAFVEDPGLLPRIHV